MAKAEPRHQLSLQNVAKSNTKSNFSFNLRCQFMAHIIERCLFRVKSIIHKWNCLSYAYGTRPV